MTTENKSIWHTPEAVPDYTQAIVFLYKSGVLYAYEPSEQSDNSPLRPLNELTEKWAYISDLVSASKALDVAIDALKNATEYLGNQNPLYEIEAMKLHIDLSKSIEKIESIMKGDK